MFANHAPNSLHLFLVAPAPEILEALLALFGSEALGTRTLKDFGDVSNLVSSQPDFVRGRPKLGINRLSRASSWSGSPSGPI